MLFKLVRAPLLRHPQADVVVATEVPLLILSILVEHRVLTRIVGDTIPVLLLEPERHMTRPLPQCECIFVLDLRHVIQNRTKRAERFVLLRIWRLHVLLQALEFVLILYVGDDVIDKHVEFVAHSFHLILDRSLHLIFILPVFLCGVNNDTTEALVHFLNHMTGNVGLSTELVKFHRSGLLDFVQL